MEQMVNRWYVGYRQKRQYQPSFLIACAIAYGLCVVAALLLVGGQQHEPPVQVALVAPWGEGGAPECGAAGSDAREVRRVRWGSRKPAEYRSGYLGEIRIVREFENSGVTRAAAMERGIPEEPVVQPLDFAAGEAGYGTGEGEFWGAGTDPFGLGPSSPYLPAVNRGSPWGMERSSPGKTRVATIELDPPNWPFLADAMLRSKDTAIVYVWLLIRADGTIKYEILKQIPDGYGFGASVEAALLRSEYDPPMRDGREDSVSFVLQVLMCPQCDSYVASAPDNVRATMRRRPR